MRINVAYSLRISFLAVCLILAGLFYQRLLTPDFEGILVPENVAKWKDRAPRSVNRDYELEEAENSPKDLESNPSLKTVVDTATSKPMSTLNDIFITVKTTKKFHKNRLDIITKTWFNLAKEQTWFFTDADDALYNLKTGGHLINTNCSSTHQRKPLCCKMAREFDTFLESSKRWWCHFDDDNYVNIPALVRVLQSFNPREDWYLGKPSINTPLKIANKEHISGKATFWFATGGAGFCVSRSLALKMMPIAGGGKFMSIGDKIRLPDDVTMGYIIEYMLGKKLTLVEEFHSHLEPMRILDTRTLANQISFSYSKYSEEMNVLLVDGLSEKLDPTRLLSLHCKLFPETQYCKF